MTPTNTIKEISSIKYFTGAHQKIRDHYQAGRRPTEFGNKVWATSLVLLNYLEERPFELQGLRVLEIGCGWGLLGIYLAKTFGCRVTCSDLDEHVLPIVQDHARLNNVAVATKKAAFSELDTEFLKDFDLIVGAEVCYSEEVGKEITSLIDRAFLTNLGHILIADPGRPDFQDCCDYTTQKHPTEIFELPGSVNGKTTLLLSVHNSPKN